MSYSFTVRGSERSEVMDKVRAELGKVVMHQKVHNADQAQAAACVEAFLNVVGGDPSRDFEVSVHGSLSWEGLEDNGAVHRMIGASVGVSCSLVAKLS